MNRKPLPDYIFVLIQLALFVALYFVRDNTLEPYLRTVPSWIFLTLQILGFALSMLAVLQLKTRISIFPSPTKDTKLITSCAYKYFRHPIYTGLILFFASLSLATNSIFRLVLTVVLFTLFNQKAKYEEQLLIKVFPAYKEYMKKTWRILPGLGKITKPL
jgi:protein-S-isoprenylcysteine O-methyltransferase Ste14